MATTAIAIMITIPTILISNAQQVTTQKSFMWPHNPSGILDDRDYTNGEDIQYDIAGYPVIQIIVYRWNEISVAGQALIITRLTAEGYDEGPEVNSETGEAVNSILSQTQNH